MNVKDSPAREHLAEAALALATMGALLAEFRSESVHQALVTAIVALRSGQPAHGLVRLENVRDDVAELAAKLALEVIKLDTAIKNLDPTGGQACCTTTQSAD